MPVYLTTEDHQRSAVGERDFESLYDLPRDDALLDTDILSAETEVDAHLSRYRLPLTNTRAITYVRTALVGPLFAERAWRHAAGEEIPKKIHEAAKQARDLLDRIRRGLIDLAGADAAASDEAASTLIVTGNPPQFDRPNMEPF